MLLKTAIVGLLVINCSSGEKIGTMYDSGFKATLDLHDTDLETISPTMMIGINTKRKDGGDKIECLQGTGKHYFGFITPNYSAQWFKNHRVKGEIGNFNNVSDEYKKRMCAKLRHYYDRH